jgi:hypothetical protein
VEVTAYTIMDDNQKCTLAGTESDSHISKAHDFSTGVSNG